MPDFRGCLRQIGVSGTNAVNNVTVAAAKPGLLRLVTVVYSAAQTGNVTVTLDSGAGAAYDIVFNTIVLASATSGFYIPSTPIPFNADDAIVVSAPALSGGTSTIAIYVDRQQ